MFLMWFKIFYNDINASFALHIRWKINASASVTVTNLYNQAQPLAKNFMLLKILNIIDRGVLALPEIIVEPQAALRRQFSEDRHN